MNKLNYTVGELINKLKDYPKTAKIEIECESGIFEELNIDKVGSKVTIFTQGEARW